MEKTQTCMLPCLYYGSTEGTCPLPSEVQKLPEQQLKGEQDSVFNGALKVTGVIWPEGRGRGESKGRAPVK